MNLLIESQALLAQKKYQIGQRQSKGAGAGDVDGSFGMTIFEASSDENPSHGAPDLVASDTPA